MKRNHAQNFPWNQLFSDFFSKTVTFTNFFQKCVRVNFCNFHTVWWSCIDDWFDEISGQVTYQKSKLWVQWFIGFLFDVISRKKKTPTAWSFLSRWYSHIDYQRKLFLTFKIVLFSTRDALIGIIHPWSWSDQDVSGLISDSKIIIQNQNALFRRHTEQIDASSS